MAIKTQYKAPITLGFTPTDGDIIRGTVNGVEVHGEWNGKNRGADLYREGNTRVPFCAIGFIGEQAVILVKQASAPTTDYELHLYRYVPAGIVKIPKEYVEGLEEGMIINSSTAGSTKKFKITVDDTGTISATEVTT